MTNPRGAADQGSAGRRDGFLVGACVGAALSAGPVPAGRRRAALALADDLLAELVAGGVDLRRLAATWVAWRRDDGWEAEPSLLEALDSLEERDAPPAELSKRNATALAAALPAALASGSPRAMVAGAFHVARLLDPDPVTGLAAVALVVAAATMIEGRKDFVGDVVAAMRANDAPAQVIDAMRTIPRDPARAPTRPAENATPLEVTVWTLWQSYHRSRGVDVLRELSANSSPVTGAIAGALIGARDGAGQWPAHWIDAGGEGLILRRALAANL